VHLVYDATTNRFLPGNSVVLTDRATQCLSSFSLDFERKSLNTSAGPDMTVQSVTVDGRPASFTFAQPAYQATRTGRTIPTRPRSRPIRSAARTAIRCRPPARRSSCPPTQPR
jgi:hypothetical protein